MNTVSAPTDSNALVPDAPAEAPIPADRINELYRGEIFSEESAQIARDRIHWMCSQVDGDRVLDVGCSQGITAILLAREGCSVTAIDTHPESMAYAREEVARETPLVQGRLRLIETDLASLPEEPHFDTIVMGEVLEHQALPERFLRAGVARLKRGGRIVITTPFALHPHPDHKISVFPSHVEALARRLGLAVLHLGVEGHYIRSVLQKPGAEAVNGIEPDLLSLTERATLQSQQRLYASLDDRGEQLKKKSDTLKITQRKLNEATAGMAEAQADAAKQAAQLRQAQKEQARKLAELQAAAQAATEASARDHARAKASAQALAAAQAEAQRLEREAQVRAKAIAQAKAAAEAAEQAQAQLQGREAALAKSARKLEAQLVAARVEQEREQEQLKQRNAQLKERLAALKESMRATKATTSYRLGRILVRGLKTPRGCVGLPGELWTLGREVLARRRARAALAADFGTPAPREPTAAPAPAPRRGKRAPATPLHDDLSVETLKARLERDGLDALKASLHAAARHGGSQQLAFRALQLGKAVSEASAGTESDFELAEVALSLDRSDQTLRGYFWAAQRARRFQEACRAIRELEALYGAAPNAKQKALLDKLRISPSYQLSALELVADRHPPSVERIPRRIGYVLHNSLPYSSGGYGTRSHGVAGGICDAGYEVVVLTRPGFPLDIKPELTVADVPAEDVIDGIRYVRTLEPPRKGMSMLRYVTEAADALESRLRELRPELVVAASNHVTALPALIAARRLGLPFVYEIRGLWEITRISREQEFEDTAAFAVQSLLEAKVAELADHVFTLTEPMREELSRRGVAADKIDLLPNSCSPERFLPRERDQELATRLGIPPGTPVIGYIGTFVDYEGLDDLTVACTLLKRRGVRFRLMLVGNENASGTDRGPITEKILQTAREGGMDDWLVMPGRVPHDEVESYYSLIDVAPFPRKPWPVCEMVSPMKPLEALAMEKAVVVSSVRALTDMIADGQTGRVFQKGRIESLVDVLEALVAAPQERTALGRRGREWVSAERTWKQVGQLFASKMQGLLTPPAPAPVKAAEPKPSEAAATAPVASVPPTPAVPQAAAAPQPAAKPQSTAERPPWWNQVDRSLRSQCEFVDVTQWSLGPTAASLRERYVERFGPEAVERRIPASNWARADVCVRTVEPTAELMDIGSGLGEFVNLAALEGRHGRITSVDMRDWDLWFDATGRLQRAYSDLFALDPATHSSEVVTCFEVIEHLPPERVADAVRKLRSLARRKLYVSVPFLEPLPLYRGHHTRFDETNLRELFPDARFTVFGKGRSDQVRAWILCEVDIA